MGYILILLIWGLFILAGGAVGLVVGEPAGGAIGGGTAVLILFIAGDMTDDLRPL